MSLLPVGSTRPIGDCPNGGFRHTASKDAPISEPCPLMPGLAARSLPSIYDPL